MLLAVLKTRALEFKDTPTVGRTHGMHAEPTTFGLKLLNWYAEMRRNQQRFEAAAEQMRVGKLSGAVGTFGHIKPEQEERICARLGLDRRARRHAGHPARPPRVLPCHAGGDHRDAATRSPPRFAICSAPKSARPRNIFLRKAKRLLGDAAQAQPHHCRADLAASPASSAPTPRPRWKTSLSGTSATSRTPRSSASSCPTRLSSPTTCSPKPRDLHRNSSSIPRACRRISTLPAA